MKILLTGGAGYIGSQVANLLLDQGHKVTIIDSLVTGHLRLVPKRAKFIKSDIANKSKIQILLKKTNFDIVVHFAGLIKVDESVKKPKKYNSYNFNKAKIFLDTCIKNGLKNIVFSSTASIYGNSKKSKLKESAKKNPLNPYAKSKLKLENYLITNIKQKKINCIILRYFNVAGADKKMRSGLISKYSTHLIKKISEVVAKKRKKLVVYGNNYNTYDGTPVRDFIHVDDLATIHLHALKYLIKNKKNQICNCGYGKGNSIKEIIKTLQKHKQIDFKYSFSPKRIGDISYMVANINKLNKIFSWKPKKCNIKNMLFSELKWNKKIYK